MESIQNNEMRLCVIMPIFNEEESIKKTAEEWLQQIRPFPELSFVLYLIDDGSKDQTFQIISELEQNNPEVVVYSRPNKGHGASCLEGYRFATENNFDLILQLDSDGQCDPKYFKQFLEHINRGSDAVYGLRFYRKDGLVRYWVSRILSIAAWARTGVWFFDPNVPYRLFKTQTISAILPEVHNITLVNVWLALYHKKNNRIHFVPIVFRDRWGGSPSVKIGGLWKWGKQFWIEFGQKNLPL